MYSVKSDTVKEFDKFADRHVPIFIKHFHFSHRYENV